MLWDSGPTRLIHLEIFSLITSAKILFPNKFTTTSSGKTDLWGAPFNPLEDATALTQDFLDRPSCTESASISLPKETSVAPPCPWGGGRKQGDPHCPAGIQEPPRMGSALLTGSPFPMSPRETLHNHAGCGLSTCPGWPDITQSPHPHHTFMCPFNRGFPSIFKDLFPGAAPGKVQG